MKPPATGMTFQWKETVTFLLPLWGVVGWGVDKRFRKVDKERRLRALPKPVAVVKEGVLYILLLERDDGVIDVAHDGAVPQHNLVDFLMGGEKQFMI